MEHHDGDLVTSRFQDYANYLLQQSEYGGNFKAVLHFDIEQRSQEQMAVFSNAVRLAYKWGRLTGNNLCLSVEEVHHFAGPTSIDKWLFESVMTGRHSNMAIIASSQRPASVHKGIVSQAHHVFVGQLFEKRDIEYLYQTIGGEAAERVSTLKPYEFIHYQGQGIPFQVVTNQ